MNIDRVNEFVVWPSRFQDEPGDDDCIKLSFPCIVTETIDEMHIRLGQKMPERIHDMKKCEVCGKAKKELKC